MAAISKVDPTVTTAAAAISVEQPQQEFTKGKTTNPFENASELLLSAEFKEIEDKLKMVPWKIPSMDIHKINCDLNWNIARLRPTLPYTKGSAPYPGTWHLQNCYIIDGDKEFWELRWVFYGLEKDSHSEDVKKEKQAYELLLSQQLAEIGEVCNCLMTVDDAHRYIENLICLNPKDVEPAHVSDITHQIDELKKSGSFINFLKFIKSNPDVIVEVYLECLSIGKLAVTNLSKDIIPYPYLFGFICSKYGFQYEWSGLESNSWARLTNIVKVFENFQDNEQKTIIFIVDGVNPKSYRNRLYANCCRRTFLAPEYKMHSEAFESLNDTTSLEVPDSSQLMVGPAVGWYGNNNFGNPIKLRFIEKSGVQHEIALWCYE
jgi:hypothetical protein